VGEIGLVVEKVFGEDGFDGEEVVEESE